MGYVVPGCVEDWAWMMWENSSAVAVAVLAQSCWRGGVVGYRFDLYRLVIRQHSAIGFHVIGWLSFSIRLSVLFL